MGAGNVMFNSGSDYGPLASSSSGGSAKNSGSIKNSANAVVDPRKITSYALDSDHPVGSDKARVFESVSGFNKSNADGLISQIQDGVAKYPVAPGKADYFGPCFTIDIPVTTPNGNTVQVRAEWIYGPGSSTPRLTTIYVK